MKLLTQLLKEEIKSDFDGNFMKTFKSLISYPILQHPEIEKEFTITIDSSNFALGAILYEGEIGENT